MKRGFFRRFGFVLVLALALGAMTFPASADNLDDNLASKASQACVRFGLENGGEIKRGSKSGQYQLNAASPVSGKDLYVVRAHSASTCDGNIYFSLYYEGPDGKLYFTEEVDFDSATEDFLGVNDGFQAGQTNSLSILLPHRAQRILGVYLYKTGGQALEIDTLTIARATGPIEGALEDGSDQRFRGFQGQYVAYTADMTTYIKDTNELNSSRKNTGAIVYTESVPSGTHSAALSTYAVELVTGSDGYVNKDGAITVNYTDTLGLAHQRVVRFREGYGAVQLNQNVQGAERDYNHTITSPWFETSVREMQGLSSGYMGNYYTYQNVSETCLRPYTGTGFLLVMPQNIAQIDSINISLDEDDNLILQSVRLVELDYLGDGSSNYWNGGFGLERTRPWSGRLLAESATTEVTILGRNNVSFTVGGLRNLINYPQGEGPYLDNKGTGVGVSIQLADTLGAGAESFLAWNGRSYGKEARFAASSQMDSRAGEDARLSWYNMNIFRQECMTLTIRYRDTRGSTRQVDIPFSTTYLIYLLKENQGKLTGGSWETWISGIFQQNENVALPIRLAEYERLISVQLSYGSVPAGFTSSNSGTVDTRSDPITIENICFYEGVTSTNFNCKYDTKKLACMLQTSLTPAYSFSAASSQGQQLNGGSSISASLEDGRLEPGAPKDRDYANQYLVRIKTADIETSGTTDPVTLTLSYTDTAGNRHTTTDYSLSALSADFYGTSFRLKDSYSVADPKLQYDRHMRRNCRCEFVVELDDVATIDAITLTLDGTNEWQIEYVEVYALESVEQRYGERSADGGDTAHLYWRRDFTGRLVATVRQDVLLYDRANQRTINFSLFDENGEPVAPDLPLQTEEYLTSLPDSMTYEETLKNLGLAIPKFVYQVDVKVADLEDAGSGNYFYFQLVFENGTSGVVLANQQLASDSFRRGITESFQIKTTQNYGNIRSVRVICDNTSSTSNVFDKLNIENITVTLQGNTGVSRSWVVSRVGWIDITYMDEGSENGIDGLDDITQSETDNVEVVKEFPVTGTATAVDLLFCIATSKDSAGVSQDGAMMSDPFNSALGGGQFSATLYYRDSSGQQQSYAFDLTAQIKAYNDTDKTHWLYRPTHMDRFMISLTDVRSITALEITRSGGSGVWKIDMVSVTQVGGLGEVFLSPVLSEFYREPNTETELTQGTNGQPVSIPANNNATISFRENVIEVQAGEEDANWSTSISRIPDASSETLNIYLYPGTLLGKSYTFREGDQVTATLVYTSIYGGRPVQNTFQISSLGEFNDTPVLYAKNQNVSLMSAIRLLKLSSGSTSTRGQPIISHVIIERVKGGVLLDTYYFDMGNAALSSTQPEASISGRSPLSNMNQVARLQLASGQSAKLTPEISDIAVALRYTTALDPAENKTVYQSPYFYLTDFTTSTVNPEGQTETRQLYSSISSGQIVDLPFDIDGIGEIIGLSVVSSGPNVSFDRAVVNNYLGDPQNNAAANLDSSCYISDSFTTGSIPISLAGQEQPVVPVTFRFVTPAEEVVAGAGTFGSVNMTVGYQDFDGDSRTVTLDNIVSYLPEGGSFASGSTTEFTVLLTGAKTITSLTIHAAEDAWFINSAYVQSSLPDGTITMGETTVNNWSKLGGALTIDIRPDSMRGDEVTGNQLLTFAVTGRGSLAGIAASAASGSALQITAYPGDTVTLTPTVTVQGEPDATWTWVPGEYENNLIVNADGSAIFYINADTLAGTSYTFSVHCVGDQRMSVPITIAVEDPPPEPEPEPDPEPIIVVVPVTDTVYVPTPTPTPDPTPDPDPEPSPDPTPDPDPEPSPDPTPDPDPDPAPDPTPDPDPDPAPDPTPDPTPDPVPDPEPTPDP